MNITLFRITGNDTNELGTRTFRVKPLPAPVPFIEGKNSGYILKDKLVNTDGIQIITSDFDFDVEYKIIGYRIDGELKRGSFVGYVAGNNIYKELRELFSLMGDGKSVSFTDITVIGPDSLTRNLGSISLRVVEAIPWYDKYVFDYQMNDFINQKNWNGMKQLALDNVDRFYTKNPMVLNSTAWKFYLYIDDTLALNKAIQWSERAVNLSKKKTEYMDTYALLLFKLGRLDEAEMIERAALSIAQASNKPTDAYEKLLRQIRESR